MADVQKGKENVVAVGTTWVQLDWTNGKPTVVSVKAVDDDVYVCISSTAGGQAAPGASYWPVLAGTVEAFDISGSGPPMCIASPTSVNAFVWGK